MALSNAAAWGLLAVSAFLVTAMLFRVLGPASFGAWATVAALRGFALFLEGGLLFGAASAGARLAGAPHEATRLFRASLQLSVLIGGVTALLGAVLAGVPGLLLDLSGSAATETAVLMMILALEAGVALASAPLHGAVRGIQRFEVLAVGAAVQGGLAVILVLLLAPSWGITGAGLALLTARLAGIVPSFLALRRFWPDALSIRTRRLAVRASVTFAAPLWLVAAGTQLSLGTDVPIVAAFFGAEAPGAYAIGAVVPATAAALLYALLDAGFPRLARGGRDAAALFPLLLRAAAALAALGHIGLVLTAPAILSLWVGTADPLAVDVLRLYSIAWAFNAPAHVLVLQAVAKSSHRLLAPIVLGEAVVNLGLSIALASAGMATGPAMATLITLLLSNLLVVPVVILRRLDMPNVAFVQPALQGYSIGVAAALPIVGVAAFVDLPPPMLLLVVLALTAIGAGAIAFALVNPAAPERAWTFVRHRGIGTWLRQRREVAAARKRLVELRQTMPIVWHQSVDPLVTVRIATYNRGALVRDRAIASALRQTYRNVEVVVVGDHCDEATEAAVRSVDDPRVHFENLSARGAYPAEAKYRWMVAGSTPMNRALDLARGEWIAPLDDDDEFTPDHVEVLINACRSRSLEFAYGIAEMEVEPGRWERVGSEPLRHGHIVHAAVLFWRGLSVVRHDVDAWRLHEPADWNVWRRMRAAGARIGFVDEVVTRHYLERREIG